MVQVFPQSMSFQAFLDWYPNNGQRYELQEGFVKAMTPTGTHEEISGFLAAELNLEIRRQSLPFIIPRGCLVKPNLEESGFFPDVAVLDPGELGNESLWKKSSVIQRGLSIPLVIEVVSTNWRDDYGTKLVKYEALGIREYWIVDYLALGAVRYIGKPKQPTITICQLIEEEYQLFSFITGQILRSQIFPELTLKAEDIFSKGI